MALLSKGSPRALATTITTYIFIVFTFEVRALILLAIHYFVIYVQLLDIESLKFHHLGLDGIRGAMAEPLGHCR